MQLNEAQVRCWYQQGPGQMSWFGRGFLCFKHWCPQSTPNFDLYQGSSQMFPPLMTPGRVGQVSYDRPPYIADMTRSTQQNIRAIVPLVAQRTLSLWTRAPLPPPPALENRCLSRLWYAFVGVFPIVGPKGKLAHYQGCGTPSSVLFRS